MQRFRPDAIPSATWAALALALLLGALALAADAAAVTLALLAAGAVVWAVREARRQVITPSGEDRSGEEEQIAQIAPLLEALPDPALLIDAQDKIAGSNAAARRQMQFEARGQFLTSIIRHPDVLKSVQAAVRNGATRAVEFETAGDVDRHTRCYVAPVNWRGARAALLVFHDQTARISTERMRADFLANASHELRTPLASLTLLIETIAGPARDNAEERERFLRMMQVQADRMRRLIDDLLSLSRIELDEHVPPSDRADLCAVVREAADMLGAAAAERGVKIEFSPPEETPLLVVGDRFQLVQVVQNLVDNAVKYTPQGGVVRIEADRTRPREDVAEAIGRRWPDAGRIALLAPAGATGKSFGYVRVEDSGPGIAERFLPRLGQRFFRVERELGDEKGGTGLGLAIVKHIVNRHRGGLIVESQSGRGSAFVAYVELAPSN